MTFDSAKKITVELYQEAKATEAPLPPEMLTDEQYFSLVQRLLRDGTSAAKKNTVYLFHMPALDATTDEDHGEIETTAPVHNGKWIAFDPDMWSHEEALEAFKHICTEYRRLTLEERATYCDDINNGRRVRFRAAGIWTIDADKIRRDYQMVEPNVFAVREGTGRLCLSVEETMTFPYKWGPEFSLRTSGGAIAVPFEEVPALVQAVRAVEAVQTPAERAKAIDEKFFKTENGNRVSVFDIYGMFAGFYDQNYEPAAAPPETSAALTSYRTMKISNIDASSGAQPQ